MAKIQYGDILLINGEIQGASDGDILTGNAKEQQVGAITSADWGNFRKHPTLGANLTKKLDGVADSRDITASLIDSVAIDGWELQRMDIQTANEVTDVTILDAEKITDNTDSLI